MFSKFGGQVILKLDLSVQKTRNKLKLASVIRSGRAPNPRSITGLSVQVTQKEVEFYAYEVSIMSHLLVLGRQMWVKSRTVNQ